MSFVGYALGLGMNTGWIDKWDDKLPIQDLATKPAVW